MLASSHKPERRKLLTSTMLILCKAAKVFVAVGIPKNDNQALKRTQDPEPYREDPWPITLLRRPIGRTQYPGPYEKPKPVIL